MASIPLTSETSSCEATRRTSIKDVIYRNVLLPLASLIRQDCLFPLSDSQWD